MSRGRVFVTGATGFLGGDLVLRLAGRGYAVRALYRTEAKRRGLEHPAIVWVRGDLAAPASLAEGMRGAEAVIHAAAFAGAWSPNEKSIFELNVDGTRAVLDAAREAGIRKIVHVSSGGVLGPSGEGLTDETNDNRDVFYTPYDRSKRLAEALVAERVREGQPVVTVNPTRIYGPGPMNEANSVTRMIRRYLAGRWRLIPGDGEAVANYVLVKDVSEGVILAMERGRVGERYILGGENVSYNDLFRSLDKIARRKRKMIRLPGPVLLPAAGFLVGLGRVSGVRPPVTPGLVKKFVGNWRVTSAKAEKELGYVPTPLGEGLRETVAWLESQGRRKDPHGG
ncbi:MAG: SDR family oxidoreductase [Candidatus Aminicenantes bacterium]|nr:SDR family oxidoreductase [Candidatus Aminicenantes bacterium]